MTTDHCRADRHRDCPGRHRREPAAAGRHPQGHRRVRVLLRHVARGHAVGQRPCARPHPHARIRSHRHRPRRSTDRGCHAVLTHDDLPGEKNYGLEHDTSRSSPTARSATTASRSRWSPPTTRRPPAGPPRRSRSTTRSCRRVTDAAATALDARRAATVHPPRRQPRPAPPAAPRRRGPRPPPVVVVGRVRGRHAGPGVPRPGVRPRRAGRGRRRRPLRRHPVAARRPAPDRPALGLPEEKVRLTLSGVGGAFGGREDLSMQIHACLLALRTGKPVKIVYNRFESFFGHVHRHPARLRYEHGATRDGKLIHVEGEHRAGRRRVRVLLARRRRQRRLARRRPVRGRRTSTSRRSASTPTTRPAAPCAASARCRRASPTRRRWTSWPTELGHGPGRVPAAQRAWSRAP